MNRIAPDNQQFPGQGMTYKEWVISLIPGLSERDADRVLWECTPFPLATGYDDLLPYLTAIGDELASGTTLDEIIAENYRRMDEETAADLLAAEGQLIEANQIPERLDEDPDHIPSRPIEVRSPNPDLL